MYNIIIVIQYIYRATVAGGTYVYIYIYVCLKICIFKCSYRVYI